MNARHLLRPAVFPNDTIAVLLAVCIAICVGGGIADAQVVKEAPSPTKDANFPGANTSNEDDPIALRAPVNPPSTVSSTVESPTETKLLKLHEAIELAIANDPTFQQIHWQIEKAKGDRLQATRLPNPTAGVSANEIFNEGSAGQYGVFWSQSVVRNNRQAIQDQYFSIELAAAEFRYDVRRWQVTRTIAKHFLSISRFQQQRDATKQQLVSVGEILKITDELFEAGEISEIDSSNIELEIAALNQQLVEVDLSIDFERRALAIPLNIVVDTNGQAVAPLQTDFDWSTMVDGLLQTKAQQPGDAWIENHPQLNVARAMTKQSQSRVALARAGRCPDIQVQGSLSLDMASEDVFAGFQIGVPILKHDDKSGAIHAATAEYSRRLEGERLVRMKLQSGYTMKAGELARFQSRVANIRDVIIPKATENLKQIQSAYEAGEAEFVLLKSGFDRALQAQLELIDAQFQMALAEAQLQTILIKE